MQRNQHVVNCVNYRPVLVAQECVNGLLSSQVCAVLQTESDDPRVNRTNLGVRVANTTVNYICRENVEGILRINLCFFILGRVYLAKNPCSHFV